MRILKQVLSETAIIGSDYYKFVHGKYPSGRGTWYFSKHRGGVDWSKHQDGVDHISHNGLFSEAKHKAKEWAKKNGHKGPLFICT